MNVAWSGEKATGPSYSGMEAMADGFLPEHELVKVLPALLKAKGFKYEGRITAKRVRLSIIAPEKHHWKDSRGVRLVNFYNVEKAVKGIIELGEYFND